jgi:uncharacterized protein (DUF2236 family)
MIARMDEVDEVAAELCPLHGGQGSVELEAPREPFDMHAPDSLTIRTSGDIRSYLMAGRTFLMQVAHPAVGAGVWEMSNFRNDPWHRLRELDRSGIAFAFSGRQAAHAEGKRLRLLHRDIQGVDTRGRKYHSLQPHVYGWVHTVFLDSMITMHELYATPLTRTEQERLFIEWRQAGRLFGLQDRDMPDSLDRYFEYYERMIETELEYTKVVEFMLSATTPPRPPALARMPQWAWKRAWRPLGELQRTLTLASLPPSYRAKIAAHHPWTEGDERRQRRLRAFVRRAVPLLPRRVRFTAPSRAAMCPV